MRFRQMKRDARAVLVLFVVVRALYIRTLFEITPPAAVHCVLHKLGKSYGMAVSGSRDEDWNEKFLCAFLVLHLVKNKCAALHC